MIKRIFNFIGNLYYFILIWNAETWNRIAEEQKRERIQKRRRESLRRGEKLFKTGIRKNGKHILRPLRFWN